MSMMGVTFGSKHSYDDWHVYLDGLPEIDYPEEFRYTVEVPFRNGLLDLTSSLTDGRKYYKPRKVKYKFKVIDNPKTLQDLYSMIARDVHGKALHVTSDTDPDFYWDAYICSFVKPTATQDVSTFSIECECYPYKREVIEQDMTFTLPAVSSGTSSMSVNIENLAEWINPYISSTNNIKVTANGASVYPDSSATLRTFDAFVLSEGTNRVTFASQGSGIFQGATINLKFRRGDF